MNKMSGNSHLKSNNNSGSSSNRNSNHQNNYIQNQKSTLFGSSEYSLRRLLVEGARSVRNSSTLLTGDIMNNDSNSNTSQSQYNLDIEKGVQTRTDKTSALFNEGTSKQYSKVINVSELEKCPTFPLIHNASAPNLPHDFTKTSSTSKLNFSSFLSKTKLNQSESDTALLPPRSDSTGQFFCPICYNTPAPPNEFYILFICKHIACRICLEHYLRNEINESRTDLTCPQCSECIHPSDMEVLLKNHPKFILKYEEFMIRRYLLTNPDSRWCPAPDCSYAVIAQGCASCPKIQCQRPECGISFCYHCKAEWHPDQTCDAARAKRRLSGQYTLQSAHDLHLRDDIKPCPKCQVLIVKMDDGSCNHMVCSICKAEFCWLCMKEISDLHFLSPSGCTFWGKKPWSRKKKLMWQLGTLVGAPVGIALVAGICVPAMIIGIPVWVGKKIYARYRQETKQKRNCALLSGVLGSILISPVVAGLVVAIGIPILLFYVYGVVPISLCRTGCGVSPTRDGFKFEFHEDEEEKTAIVNNPISQLNVSQHEALNTDGFSGAGTNRSYGDVTLKIEDSNISLSASNLNTSKSYDMDNFHSIDTKLDGISTVSLAESITQRLEIKAEISKTY